MVHRLQQAITASLLLSLSLFLLAPTTLFTGEGGDNGIPFLNLVLVALPIVIAATLVLAALAALVGRYVDLRKVYAVLAVAIIAKVALVPSAVPLLDGQQSFYGWRTWNGTLSIVSLLAALAAGLLLVRRYDLRFLGFGLVLASAFAAQPLLSADNWTSDFSPKVFPYERFSPQTNTLVVLMDTLQTDIFAEVLDKNGDLRSAFDGFTLFHNTIGRAPFTLLAMMPIYSGRIYESGSIKRFYQTAKEDSVFTDFDVADYDTLLAGHYFFDICPADHCVDRSSMLRRTWFQSNAQSYKEILEASWLRITPTFMHAWMYNRGKGRLRLPYLGPGDGRASESVFALELFTRGLTATSEKPTFKFIHLMTTHWPIVMDASCSMLGRAMPGSRAGFEAQAHCAIVGFSRLLAKMKEAGVYDNTTIVLMADHGAPLLGAVPEGRYLGSVIPFSAADGGLFKPLFAVKPQGAKGEIKLSAAPVQNSDLRKTICTIAKICPDTVPGADAFSLAPEVERERTFVDVGSFVHSNLNKWDELPPGTYIPYKVGNQDEDLKRIYKFQARLELDKKVKASGGSLKSGRLE